jgi:hypothetical protein
VEQGTRDDETLTAAADLTRVVEAAYQSARTNRAASLTA